MLTLLSIALNGYLVYKYYKKCDEYEDRLVEWSNWRNKLVDKYGHGIIKEGLR